MNKRLLLSAIMSLGLCVGCAHHHHHEEEEGEEANEVKVTLDQVPQAARESLIREANGEPIKSVDKEMQNGRTIYETDVMMNGKNWEIKVAEDGTVVGKRIDNEDEEKHVKKDKDDDEKEEKK